MAEKPLGTNNPGFHGSSHLHSVIVHHVIRTDSQPYLSPDELHLFKDEGLDSDVDDLSQLDSGDEEDWDQTIVWKTYL